MGSTRYLKFQKFKAVVTIQVNCILIHLFMKSQSKTEAEKSI